MRCQETKAQKTPFRHEKTNQIIFICDMQYKNELDSVFSIPLIQIEKPVAKSVIMIAENFDKQRSFSCSLCSVCAPNG